VNVDFENAGANLWPNNKSEFAAATAVDSMSNIRAVPDDAVIVPLI
jgi:hypothetical protein